MNLATIISFLYGGGPGSGCRGPTCGRKRFQVFEPSKFYPAPRDVSLDMLDRAQTFVVRMKDLTSLSMRLFEGAKSWSLRDLAGVRYYEEQYSQGRAVVPIELYYRGDHFDIEDGAHRLVGAYSSDVEQIAAKIVHGGRK